MKIITTEDIPIYHHPRRLPFIEREIVDKQVQEWINDGIIESCTSEYASQVVIVKKKDGSHRLCIDYRKLNKVVVKDRYPLPLIEDQLDRLQEAGVFSTLDLKNGFFHVPVEEQSRKYTAFVTHNSQYQFLKVPFGFCNSPSVFQRFINTIFSDMARKGIALPYMDDLIIPAKDKDEAVKRLQTVLERSRDYGLEINMKKCRFLQKRVEFLGHVIENGRIEPSDAKTKADLRFQELKTIKQVQSFLGLTGYFRKLLPQYSVIARPLTDLLQKNQMFKFQEKEKIAFETLKSWLADKPVLEIYRQGADTELHTDASQEGYGAVLMQKSRKDNRFHPVYYMSKKTTQAERKYCSYELEVLAIVEALKKFRIYLLGHNFKIITDCNAFQKTMHKKELTTRVARWALLLEEFNYQIEHRSGSRMRHVDALSRYPIMQITEASIPRSGSRMRHVDALSRYPIMQITEASIPRIRKAQDKFDQIKTIKEILCYKEYDDYFMRTNLLYKVVKDRELLVVPKDMQVEVIRSAHERGHFACRKTRELIEQEYFIPSLQSKVERFITNCLPCIMVNRKAGKKEGYLQAIFKEAVAYIQS
ncbi:Reverse transcriptase (RNA-dependent DNA polymerase) [Popillia japonica]|uniref:RNA-directed DNA polymerase n=1 Tax=Popillia japonica TaxID=7064 RepID=A0AAW1N5C6_POPJA